MRSSALALARALLCENPASGEIDACGVCGSCRLVEAKTHPDLHVVSRILAGSHPDPTVRRSKMQELGIDVIKQFLLLPAKLASMTGRGKVFVVLEAELMSTPAQNALLKTLEEPPPGVTIILLTRKAQQLLPTTLSRCWKARFGYLPLEFVTQKLVDQGVEGDEATFWAVFTGGSLGRGLSLSGRGMYEVKRDLVTRLAKLTSKIDPNLSENLRQQMEKLAAGAIKQSKADQGPTLSDGVAKRQGASEMIQLIASVYRDALYLTCNDSEESVSYANIDQFDDIVTIANRFDPEQLCEIIEQLSRFEQLLWRNVNARIIWDNVVVTCASAVSLGM